MNKDIKLTDNNFTLVRYQAQDAAPVYQAVKESIQEVSIWMPWCHEKYSMEDSRTWSDSRDEAWNSGQEFDFTINDKNESILYGVCGLNHIDHESQMANMGYWVRTSMTKQGAATSAVQMLARFGFDHLNLNRVEIVVAIGNIASQRVAQKAGAKREGFLRKRIVVHGHIHDAVMYSLIPEDIV